MMKKPNGSMIETKDSYAEKQRQLRRITVGEMERAFNQMGTDLERFANAMMARVERLEAHVGYVPPEAPTPEMSPAVQDQQQQTGGDIE